MTHDASSELPSIRVYVACLASYNAGILHGKWLALDDFEGPEELQAAIFDQVLKTSTEPYADEWAMHDYEGLPEGYSPSEWPDWADLFRIRDLLEEHGEIFEAALSLSSGDIDYAEEMVTDYYTGFNYDHFNYADYGQDFLESTGMIDAVPENLRYYIDYHAYGRDLFLGGDVQEHNGYVFYTH